MKTRATLLNATVGYGAHALLKGLNLNLQAGQLVCLMGANGSGKSTLLRVLAQLQEPLEGQLILYPDANARPAVVLTDRIQTYHLVVRDLVAFGRYPHLNWDASLRPADYAVVNRTLEQVGIAPLADQPVAALSDGQLQLAMVARALAQETDLILLDEPTAHLDLNNRVAVMLLLRDVAHRLQKAVLVVTHELDLALQMADRIWLLTPDQTVAEGIPEDLVLSGVFDRSFAQKGFDLRTGKVNHTPYRNRSFQVRGDGFTLLWTKNALERAGYSVDERAPETISLHQPGWRWNEKVYDSLQQLLESLEATSPK